MTVLFRNWFHISSITDFDSTFYKFEFLISWIYSIYLMVYCNQNNLIRGPKIIRKITWISSLPVLFDDCDDGASAPASLD